MQESYDSLIIGHGLAGAILAHTLIGRGQRVMVLDHDQESSASKIAAGIINPVTGHRLNITEGFEHLMPAALDTYKTLTAVLGETLYSPLKQIRLIKNTGQFEYFNKRLAEERYQGILGAHIAKPLEFIAADFGAAEVLETATVNTNKLLTLSREYLIARESYRGVDVDYQSLEIHQGGVDFADISAARVIFCEGYKASQNPWLQNLPFKLAKGEIVNLKLDSNIEGLLNWGNWLMPDSNTNNYRLGSTYEWADLSLVSHKSASLLESLYKHTGLRGQFISADVGIRPTTVHRTPFVGGLSTLSNSYCFNGFGSKGCLLIPTYANQLADNIIDNKPLARELSKWL